MSKYTTKSSGSSGSARGRIQQVLAQARATLQEPSRPITPAGLDARIDLIPDYGFAVPKVKKNSLQYTNSLASSSDFNKSLSRQVQRSGSMPPNSILTDSTILLLDDSLSRLESDLYSNDTNQIHLSLQSITPVVDKFAKYLRSKIDDDNMLQNGTYQQRAIELFTRILDENKDHSIRQLCCRHIFKIHHSKYPVVAVHIDDARLLLRTTRDLYMMANEKTTSTQLSTENMMMDNSNRQFLSDPRASENRYEESASNSLSQPVSVVMGDAVVDQIIDFLGIVWVQVNLLYERNDAKKGARDEINVIEKKVDYGAIKLFLESCVYACGVLRCYSMSETCRKRLYIMNSISIINEGLITAINISSASKPKASSSARSGGSDTVMVTRAERDLNVTMSQLGSITVQLIAILRNFSLDAGGRNILHDSKCLYYICNIITLYSDSNMELILNCVRVTAKLSLYDIFRSQINKKIVYIESLVNIIIKEADMCTQIMNSSHSDITVNDSGVSWPSWYTWPLLSRTAFTLGNLTTTNDTNRILIATNFGCIKPLIMLLQTCACSLTSLYSGSGVEEEDNDDEGFEGEGEGDDEGEEEEDENEGDYESDRKLAEQELGDATVKLVRLFANLSISETIGEMLSRRRESLQMILEMLICASIGDDHEELLLNVVAACTNLTFYTCRMGTEDDQNYGNMTPRSSMPSSTFVLDSSLNQLKSLANHLSNCLFHQNEEIVLEAARALGNLTRCEPVIESLCHNRASEALVLLLVHANFDILLAVTGAFINISAHPSGLITLASSEQPIQSLAQILRKSSFKNLQLTTLVCQVFHNLILHNNTEYNTSIKNNIFSNLSELVDCAEDLADDSEMKYNSFLAVGRMVLDCLDK